MLLDYPCIQYRSISILLPLLSILLTSSLTLMDPHFLQYMYLPGLPFHVVNSVINPLRSARLTQPPFSHTVDDYCTSISESFLLDIVHTLLYALILSSVLLSKSLLRFAHGITLGYLLLFQVSFIFTSLMSVPDSYYYYFTFLGYT